MFDVFNNKSLIKEIEIGFKFLRNLFEAVASGIGYAKIDTNTILCYFASLIFKI